MHFIIEEGIYDNEPNIIQAINRLGFTYSLVDYQHIISGKKDQYNPDEQFKTGIGSCKFLKYSGYLKYAYTWCDFDLLKCSSYYPVIGGYKLNELYHLKPFGDLCYKDLFNRNKQAFVRPNTNDKIFDGVILDKSTWMDWYKKTEINPYIQPQTLCLVSRQVKNIDCEVRLICSKDKIITFSIYKTNKPICSPENKINAFVAQVWNHKLKSLFGEVMNLYTMDIAICNNHPYVLELGSINCSNWYTKDETELCNILKAIEKECKG